MASFGLTPFGEFLRAYNQLDGTGLSTIGDDTWGDLTWRVESGCANERDIDLVRTMAGHLLDAGTPLGAPFMRSTLQRFGGSQLAAVTHPLDQPIIYVRSVLMQDADALVQISAAGQYTTHNLQPDQDLIRKKIAESMTNFGNGKPTGDKQSFMFTVLSTPDLGGVPVGTSAFYRGKFSGRPQYAYRVRLEPDAAQSLVPMLVLDQFPEHSSEVGAIVVHPAVRGLRGVETRNFEMMLEGASTMVSVQGAYGRAISLARFFWLGINREAESAPERVVVEYRPQLEKDGAGETNAFYELVVRPVYDGLPYSRMDGETVTRPSLLELLPREIPLDNIPHAARRLLGTVDMGTPPAVRLLESIGFRDSNQFDPLDAALYQDMLLRNNPVYKGTKAHVLGNIVTGSTFDSAWKTGFLGRVNPAGPVFFQAVMGPYKVVNNQIVTTHEVAMALGLRVGDTLHVSSLDFLKKKSTIGPVEAAQNIPEPSPVEISSAPLVLQHVLSPQGIKTVTTGSSEVGRFLKERYGSSDMDRVTPDWRKRFEKIRDAKVIIMGVPMDAGAGFDRGAYKGPLGVRSQLLAVDGLYDRLEEMGIIDIGDVRVNAHMIDDELYSADVLERVRKDRDQVGTGYPVSPHSILRKALQLIHTINPQAKVLVLGGDHSIAWPVVQALISGDRNRDQKLGIVHFDAHTDMLAERDGIPNNFATWAYHANNAIGRGGRLQQLGIRTSGQTRHYWESKFDLRQFWSTEIMIRGAEDVIHEVIANLRAAGVENVYISNDIDGTDPRFAAATGTAEMDGMTPQFVHDMIQALAETFNVVGSDLVELAPPLASYIPGEPARSTQTAAYYVFAQLEAMLGSGIGIENPFGNISPATRSAVMGRPALAGPKKAAGARVSTVSSPVGKPQMPVGGGNSPSGTAAAGSGIVDLKQSQIIRGGSHIFSGSPITFGSLALATDDPIFVPKTDSNIAERRPKRSTARNPHHVTAFHFHLAPRATMHRSFAKMI